MIKVESIAKDTVVTINDGVSIYVGQLISHEDYATLNVEKGSIVVSIDEKEVITVYSQEYRDKIREIELALAKEAILEKAKLAEAAILEKAKLAEAEFLRKSQEVEVPKQVEQKPKPIVTPKPSAKTPQSLHSAKTPQIFESAKTPQNLHSAKTPHIFESAKSPEIFENTGSDSSSSAD